ncbi:MAG TPA: hypothetical protein VEB20_18005 [Azospirillaceae bacterium]|nr:hypothetical protein [Azospirillaceae bacterium]
MDGIGIVREAADLSVRRACGFAGLAIFCVVVGLSFDPVMAAKSGAILTALMCATLLVRARMAPARPYRQTEVWMLLDRRLDLPDPVAQQLIGGALRDSYMLHAELSAAISVLLWVMGMVAWLAG